jgi:hypothetical protein
MCLTHDDFMSSCRFRKSPLLPRLCGHRDATLTEQAEYASRYLILITVAPLLFFAQAYLGRAYALDELLQPPASSYDNMVSYLNLVACTFLVLWQITVIQAERDTAYNCLPAYRAPKRWSIGSLNISRSRSWRCPNCGRSMSLERLHGSPS